MAYLNLPPPLVPVEVPNVASPTTGAVVTDPGFPLPVVDPNITEDAVLQKVSNALNVLGIDAGAVKAHIAAQLEAAAAAFVNAKVPGDKTFFQAEGFRLLAAFHAVVGTSAPAKVEESQ